MAQYRPDAATLLAAVADVLDDVLDDVPTDKQHRVRVAAHLARLVGRETELGPDATEAERAALTELLGGAVGATGASDVSAMSAELADRLRAGSDDDFAVAAWAALVEITRRDLDIAKPGHAGWEGP